MTKFPHVVGRSALHPVEEYYIGERVLSLYTVEGRTPSTAFSLYWNDEVNPVQHAMTCFEVFMILAQFINGDKGDK